MNIKDQRKFLDISGCTGCGCCMNICKVDAIEMINDLNSGLKPLIHTDKCVRCNKCYESCPVLNDVRQNLSFDSPYCYALWSKNEIRMKSSSGGFFYTLSRYILKQGGYVFGAVWDEDFYCHIIEGDNEEVLSFMQKSKYVQSRTDYSFRQVEKRLEENKMVAYFGCPCQIAGLKNYLERSYIASSLLDNLLTIDLICFYAPSNELFRKYLDEEYKIENIESISFRNKKFGWNCSGFSLELKNGKEVFPNESIDGKNIDSYQIAYHESLLRRKPCEKCKYSDIPRQGDFTIGDFWGIKQNDSTWDDDKGTSLVLVNNEKSLQIMNEIKQHFFRVEEVPFAWCINKGNRLGNVIQKSHYNNIYFNWLIQRKSFSDSVRMAIKNEYDVICVCMFNYNTGNNLTNYSLYRTLMDLGYSVLMVGGPKDSNDSIQFIRHGKFYRFDENPYEEWSIHPGFSEKWEYYALNDRSNCFVVGSDQSLRGSFLKNSDYFTALEWVKKEKYLFSYSSSLGTEEYDADKTCYLREAYLLKRFNEISVREDSGAIIVKEMTGKKPLVVLDPVFLCDYSYYEKLAQNAKKFTVDKNDYVGSYLLDVNDNKEKILLSLSNYLCDGNYKCITDYYSEDRVKRYGINCFTGGSIEDWLAMIKNSDFFVTDSFHGLCFAIIFRKQFAVVFEKENWRGYSRIKCLLEKIGLLDRIVNDNQNQTIEYLINNIIDYEKVYDVLNAEKKISLKFLTSNLLKSKEYLGTLDSVDLINEKEFEVKKSVRKLQNWIEKENSNSFLRGFKKKESDMIEVVAFGSGGCFERNIMLIKKVYNLKYVCDNNPSKWDTIVAGGVTCISPSKLKEMPNVLVVIMIEDVGVSFEIAKQLIDMGIYNFTHITNWLKSIKIE